MKLSSELNSYSTHIISLDEKLKNIKLTSNKKNIKNTNAEKYYKSNNLEEYFCNYLKL